MPVRRAMRGDLLTLLALAGGLLVWSFAAPAHAGVIDWNFNFTLSNGDTGNGIFITQDTPAGGPYLITSIQDGELNGSIPITLLAPDPSDMFNDNLLFTTSPWVDGVGLGFTTPDGVQWAIWNDSSSSNDSWCNNSVGGGNYLCTYYLDQTVTSFEVSDPTPLPSTWLMLLGGLVGLSLIAYRGTKNGSAAIVAA